MFHKVLVAMDGSQGAQRAFEAALQIVREQDLDLWIVTVEEKLPQYVATIDEVEAEHDYANQYVASVQEWAEIAVRQKGTNVHRKVLVGHPARQIVDFAKREQVDLLIVGHSGHSNLWGGFLGTNADKIVRHAPCIVMVVR